MKKTIGALVIGMALTTPALAYHDIPGCQEDVDRLVHTGNEGILEKGHDVLLIPDFDNFSSYPELYKCVKMGLLNRIVDSNDYTTRFLLEENKGKRAEDYPYLLRKINIPYKRVM